MGKSVVWVNGEKVAEHFGGYLPFVAEVSRHWRPGGKDKSLRFARITPMTQPIRQENRNRSGLHISRGHLP